MPGRRIPAALCAATLAALAAAPVAAGDNPIQIPAHPPPLSSTPPAWATAGTGAEIPRTGGEPVLAALTGLGLLLGGLGVRLRVP
jgi:hypothetical protein